MMRPTANLALLLSMAACADVVDPNREPLAGSWASDPSATVAGTVETTDGAPVADAWVTTDPLGYEQRTAADGSFVITRLAPGPYTILARALGATGSADVAAEADAEARVVVVLETPEAVDGVLRVWVTGPDGAPLEGAIVSAGGQSATTDVTGAASLPGLGGSAVDVTASDANGALWPWRADGVVVPTAGAAHLVATLAGRPADDDEAVGASTCALCHADVAADHAGTRHARALATLPSPPLQSAFDNGHFADLGRGAVARLQPGPEVAVIDGTGAVRTFAVAGFIGDPSHGTVPWTETATGPQPLPIAWSSGRADRPGTPDGAARLSAFQVDRWLDPDGAFRAEPAAARSATAECLPCHATGFDVDADADGEVVMTAPGGRWRDAGVTCEACHGPGGSHVTAPSAGRAATITNPARLDRSAADAVCGQCHAGVTGSDTGLPYPHADGFRPGARLTDHAVSTPTLWTNGAAAAPHQQHDELALSGHAGVLSCLDCHTAHDAGVGAPQLTWTAADNALCLACHVPRTFATRTAARAHTGHGAYDPAGPSEGGRCVGCHMPATASDTGFSPWSGDGTLASHRFLAVPPADSLAAFDGATAAPGTWPQNACLSCHRWNAAQWEAFDPTFPGPHGDPSLRATHAALQPWYAAWFP